MFDKTKANDKSYVLEAVSRNVFALQYASPELKNDKDVIIAMGLYFEDYYIDDDIGDDDIGDDIGDDDPEDIGD